MKHIHIHISFPKPESPPALGSLSRQISHLQRTFEMNAQELKAELEAQKVIAEKNQQETLSLLDQIANSSDQIPADLVEAAAALRAVLTATDNFVPDVVTP